MQLERRLGVNTSVTMVASVSLVIMTASIQTGQLELAPGDITRGRGTRGECMNGQNWIDAENEGETAQAICWWYHRVFILCSCRTVFHYVTLVEDSLVSTILY